MSLVLLATLRISTSPRKETETAIVVVNNDDLVAFQLIPARGRKPLVVCASFDKIKISTYPRKGAKNSASKMVRSFSFANLNSLFSVGYSSMNRAAAAFSLP